MKDTETILLDSLNQTAKKIERFFIGVTLLSLYSYVTILRGGEKTMEFLILKIETPGDWHLFIGIVILILFALTGSQIINYMIKRFAYDEHLFPLKSKEKEAFYELLPYNSYEIMYEYFIGAEFVGKRVKDTSRRLVVIGLYTLLHAFSTCSILNLTLLTTRLFNQHRLWEGTISLIITLAATVVIYFLWKSFYETLERRRIRFAKLKKIDLEHKKTNKYFGFIKLGWLRFYRTALKKPKY